MNFFSQHILNPTENTIFATSTPSHPPQPTHTDKYHNDQDKINLEKQSWYG